MADLSSFVERLNEYSASTYRAVDTDISNLIDRNNAFYKQLEMKGRILDFTGGHGIQEPLIIPSGEDATNFFGYDPYPVNPTTSLSAAIYQPVQKVKTVVMSGRELIENSGSEAYIDLWNVKTEAMCGELKNAVCRGMMSDGSAYEEIGGLKLIVSDSPETSIVGDIDAADHLIWRNVAVGATEQMTSANIEQYMDEVMGKLSLSGDMVDLIIADNTMFYMLKRALTEKQRFVDVNKGNLGFPTIQYCGIDVVLDGGFQGTADDGVPVGGVPDMHMYFLNTKHLALKCLKSGDGKNSSFRFGDVLQVPGRDAVSMDIHWFGQLTCNARHLQGVLFQGPIAP